MHGVASRVLPISASLILVLAACGPNTGDDGAEETEGAAGSPGTGGDGLEASGEIFVYGMSYETGDEIATTRIDHFSEQYPDVSPQFSESGFNSQEFLTALQGSDPPDVIRMPRNIVGTYIQRGVFEPIGSCLDRAGVDTSDYREIAIQQLTVDGELYGLPEAYWVRAWLVDNTLFEAADLDPAEFDWSDYDAIREADQAIRDSSDTAEVGIDPKVSDPSTADMYPLWVRAHGGDLVAEDGTPQLNSPEAVQALEFAKSIIDQYGSHAEFLEARGATGNFFGEGNQFELHTEGAFLMQQWYLNILAESSPDVDISAQPFLTLEGEPLTWADGDMIGIAADSDNKDAACAFVTAVLSTEAWIAAADARAALREEAGLPNVGTVTGNIEADEYIFNETVDLADYPNLEQAVEVYLGLQDAAFVMPQSPASEEVQQAWASAVDAVLNGNMEAQEALDQAQQEAEEAISTAGG